MYQDASDCKGNDLGDVLVLGAGRTGLVVADYLADMMPSRVSSVTLVGGLKSYATDATRALEDKGVRVLLASESIEGSYDLAIASPGIPEHSAFMEGARAHAREVIAEPEFAWRESPDRWLAITGTNGKTTTTKLTVALLEAGGLDAKAVGNVGTVSCGEVARRGDAEWFVAELSSFQLALADEFHPRVAALLNITPDHLEWHGSMEAYAEAKAKVFSRLEGKDLAVVVDADDYCRTIADEIESRQVRVCHVALEEPRDAACAAFVRKGRLVVRLDNVETELCGVDDLGIKGPHNVLNALVAAAMALEVGVEAASVIEGLEAFAPLEHRIEPCGQVAGVAYVNDSKATNVDAVAKALSAFERGRVIVLLGGHDKGTELDELTEAVVSFCKVAVCYGEAGERIACALEDAESSLAVVRAPHMAEALDVARTRALSGDTVLLSPACSSFDEFKSYTERGRVFKELVAHLIEDAS